MYQKLIIVGNLGRDPEMRYTPGGDPVTKFSTAVSRRKGTGDQAKEVTTWFTVSVWGKQAETCNAVLTKGQKVLVEGELTPDEHGGPRIWTGQDGQPRASYEMRAQVVKFLSPRGEVTGQVTGDPEPESEQGSEPF